MTWLSTTNPEAPRVSQTCQLWAGNWGHIRATCASSCLTRQLCREYGIEICLGERNPHLSVSVSSPHCCPWSIFFRSMLVTSTPSVSLMNGNVVADIQVLNRVSGHEMRTEKVEKVGPRRKMAYTSERSPRRRACYQMWKRSLDILC